MTDATWASPINGHPPKTFERRASVRHPCNLDTTCTPVSSVRTMQWTGKIYNISRGGISLCLGRRFEVGTLLSVEIPDRTGAPANSYIVRIVHITPEPMGQWVHGCAFTHDLSDEELKVIL